MNRRSIFKTTRFSIRIPAEVLNLPRRERRMVELCYLIRRARSNKIRALNRQLAAGESPFAGRANYWEHVDRDYRRELAGLVQEVGKR